MFDVCDTFHNINRFEAAKQEVSAYLSSISEFVPLQIILQDGCQTYL